VPNGHFSAHPVIHKRLNADFFDNFFGLFYTYYTPEIAIFPSISERNSSGHKWVNTPPFLCLFRHTHFTEKKHNNSLVNKHTRSKPCFYVLPGMRGSLRSLPAPSPLPAEDFRTSSLPPRLLRRKSTEPGWSAPSLADPFRRYLRYECSVPVKLCICLKIQFAMISRGLVRADQLCRYLVYIKWYSRLY